MTCENMASSPWSRQPNFARNLHCCNSIPAVRPCRRSARQSATEIGSLFVGGRIPRIIRPPRQFVLHDALAGRALERLDDGDVARLLVAREAGREPLGKVP